MAHLSPAAFIDLLDGVVDESAVPHLASCQVCRDRLGDLRRTASLSTSADVPEPSPLFWEHLSARVRAAVATEAEATPWWRRRPASWRMVSIASAAVVLVALTLTVELPRSFRTAPAVEQPSVTSPARTDEATDDEPLRFVTDLASDLDLDAAVDAGLVAKDSADRALDDMNPRERAELERLLTEALAKGGA